MPRDETGLKRLNRLFEQAVRRHGGDRKKVSEAVQVGAAGLQQKDRSELDGALQRMLDFRAPDFRREPLN